MDAGISALLSQVVSPILDAGGIGPVVAGLIVFIIGWAVFSILIGRKD